MNVSIYGHNNQLMGRWHVFGDFLDTSRIPFPAPISEIVLSWVHQKSSLIILVYFHTGIVSGRPYQVAKFGRDYGLLNIMIEGGFRYKFSRSLSPMFYTSS